MAVTKRDAARGVIVTPEGELLLMRLRFPRVEVWITPGGGIEADETPEAALRRELLEETALDAEAIGPHLWSRSVRFTGGDGVYEQRERYYLVPTRRYRPRFLGMPDDKELEWLQEFRWWRPAEIHASGDLFAPRRIGALFERLLERGVPAEPIELDA